MPRPLRTLVLFSALTPLVAGGGVLTTFKSDEMCVDSAESVISVVGSDDVVDAMRLGWWSCAEKLAESAAASGGAPNLASVVALEARTITGKMSSLRSALESALPPSQIITPAFQWAQSPDSLFLNVKFSHKLDAPATLDVSVDSVEFTATAIKLRVRACFFLFFSFRVAIWACNQNKRCDVGVARQGIERAQSV